MQIRHGGMRSNLCLAPANVSMLWLIGLSTELSHFCFEGSAGPVLVLSGLHPEFL